MNENFRKSSKVTKHSRGLFFQVQTSNETEKVREKTSDVQNILRDFFITEAVWPPSLTSIDQQQQKLIRRKLRKVFHECTFFHRKYICVKFENIFY